VNAEELAELVSDCPTLYHMAEQGSWPSIQKRGLLSTSALLDLYRVNENERRVIEEERRGTSVKLRGENLPTAVVRDQFPMTDSGLLRCLPQHISPTDWYRLLNKRVFFWLTRDRLIRLLNAGTYRDKAHDVLEIRTQEFIESYFDKIWFCPINSGCTKPMPHPRGDTTFLRIPDYPYSHWRTKRKRGERVVELVVDYAVPDVRNFVKRVVEMRGDKETRTIYPLNRTHVRSS
jgi:hypothetical protein